MSRRAIVSGLAEPVGPMAQVRVATILEVQGRVRVRPERSGGGDRVPVQADRGRVVVEGPGAVLGHSPGETADELDRRQVRRRRTLRPEVMDDQQGQQNDRGTGAVPAPVPNPPGSCQVLFCTTPA